MLSSVSYPCLGVSAGMWVISRVLNSGVLVLSFISVLLFKRSGLGWAALALKRAAPKVCAPSCWNLLRFRAE